MRPIAVVSTAALEATAAKAVTEVEEVHPVGTSVGDSIPRHQCLQCPRCQVIIEGTRRKCKVAGEKEAKKGIGRSGHPSAWGKRVPTGTLKKKDSTSLFFHRHRKARGSLHFRHYFLKKMNPRASRRRMLTSSCGALMH